MEPPSLYNLYCDESCPMENRGIPVVAWGAVICEGSAVRNLSRRIRTLKSEHGLAPGFEAKWTKVSPAKFAFYQAMVDLFLSDERLRFRGLVVQDKSLLRHESFEQSSEDWYYKMYCTMLRPVLNQQDRHRIYCDIKDTRSGSKFRGLRKYLAASIGDNGFTCVERVQQIGSHESELLQLGDILTGVLTYANRRLRSSTSKLAIVRSLCEGLGRDTLTLTSPRTAVKFNVLIRTAEEVP